MVEDTKDPALNLAVQAIPPNYIHSIDAAHLMKTVNAMAEQGVPSFSMIHDSYGCHCSFVPTMRKALTETFYEIHKQPLLQKFKEDIEDVVGPIGRRLPEKETSLLNESEKQNISSDKIANFPIVVVDWLDAVTSGGSEWQTFEDIQEAVDNGPAMVRTVGMLLKQTADYVAICDTLQSDEQGDSGGAVHVIPMGMVKSVKVMQWPTT